MAIQVNYDLSGDLYPSAYVKVQKIVLASAEIERFEEQEDGTTILKFDKVPENIGAESFTEPTPAMPDDCKIIDDAINSYRKYYQLYKAHIAKWTDRDIPDWFDKNALQFSNLGVSS